MAGFAQLHGMDLKFTAVPIDYGQVSSLDFRPATMRSLFRYRASCGEQGRLWTTVDQAIAHADKAVALWQRAVPSKAQQTPECPLDASAIAPRHSTPLMGIYAAVTRRTLDGKNPEGWVPAQRIVATPAAESGEAGSEPDCRIDRDPLERDSVAGRWRRSPERMQSLFLAACVTADSKTAPARVATGERPAPLFNCFGPNLFDQASTRQAIVLHEHFLPYSPRYRNCSLSPLSRAGNAPEAPRPVLGTRPGPGAVESLKY